MDLDSTNKIVLHVGGTYGNKSAAKKAFIKNFLNLPENIKNRLVIENDDKNYTIKDVLEISHEIKIPVIFDNLHHKLNPSLAEYSDASLVKICSETWGINDGVQKIHYSRQKVNGLPGAHSNTIFIEEFENFYNNLLNKNIDIMLEVKDKNLSAIKCINTLNPDLKARNLEYEWSKYKYLVLSYSSKIYTDIRNLLKDNDLYITKEFYKKIESAYFLPENKGAQINAAQHIWGYFKKDSTLMEKKRYEKLLYSFENNISNIKILKNHLLKCAVLRENKYLTDSLYFYI